MTDLESRGAGSDWWERQVWGRYGRMSAMEWMWLGGGRRRASKEERAEMVAECCRPGASVAAVARRHGVCGESLRRWIRVAGRAVEVERAGARPVPAYVRLVVEEGAKTLWRRVADRLAECGLEMRPQKTTVVYCKDTNRKGDHPTVAFDFLGYRFQPRLAAWRGGLFGVSFLPAASPTALKAFRRRVRQWGLRRRSDKGLLDLARMFLREIAGWIGYFGAFYKSALYPTLRLIDAHLHRWATRKFERFRRRPRQARLRLARIVKAEPWRFAHWPLLYGKGRTLGAV